MEEQTMLEVQTQETLNSMDQGDVVLLTTRPVGGDKIQLEFAEIIQTPASGNSVLGMFNKSDERFTGRSARRSWLSAEPEDAKRLIPEIADYIDTAMKEDRKVFVGLSDPQVNGKSLKIQITEDNTAGS